MRIDGSYRAPVSTRSASARAGGNTIAFRLDDQGEASRTSAASQAAATTGIDALLALQSVEDPLLARKKNMRRGRSLLDVLESVKVDLLVGRVGEGRLNYLVALLTQAREESDPELDALIDEIELRARVELAKLGRYAAA